MTFLDKAMQRILDFSKTIDEESGGNKGKAMFIAENCIFAVNLMYKLGDISLEDRDAWNKELGKHIQP